MNMMPVGDSSSRPTTAAVGSVRFNSTTMAVEVYDGTVWAVMAAGPVEGEYTIETHVATQYGRAWHCVQPVGGISNVWPAMVKWCVETLGVDMSTDTHADERHRWFAKNNKFWFRDPEDQMIFVIRWS